MVYLFGHKKSSGKDQLTGLDCLRFLIRHPHRWTSPCCTGLLPHGFVRVKLAEQFLGKLFPFRFQVEHVWFKDMETSSLWSEKNHLRQVFEAVKKTKISKRLNLRCLGVHDLFHLGLASQFPPPSTWFFQWPYHALSDDFEVSGWYWWP